MWSELLSRFGLKRHSPPQPRHPLLEDLDALDPRQRRELACALSMLWDEYADEVAGEGHSPGNGKDYVLSMHLAAYKVRQNGGPEKQHYALAPQLMALYAETLGRAKPTAGDREITAAVREVAAQGSLIRRTGAGLSSRSRG